MQFTPPVSKNRIISTFPKYYNPQACLQMKEDWSAKAKQAFKDRATRQQGLKMSKAVIVGDLNVGKTCLINRFCKDAFDRDYKATIGVDFEIERFEICGLPFSLQMLRRHRASRQDTPWTECQPIAGHTHTLIHSHSHTTDNFPEMPINLLCMSLDRGRKPEYPEETPEARGEHANSTHTRRRRESNPQPWSWDTAGQEKFKCIAAAYYRGAQVIVTVFDMTDIKTLENTKQWLTEALNENEPNSCFIFLVGTKRDLLSPEECQRTERDAVKMAAEMNAEFWSVSSKTGESVQQFFFRVTALSFEDFVLKDTELGYSMARIGDGDLIKVDKSPVAAEVKAERKSCC
ncbi:ras-related protein Rab-36 isoform X1 [Tachysurus fulvidraco]|uniref:ras-related protein Rab-36 isoform X1 n=1 Tax=Tachysurus fulvidraco TaxID=1234273 RepID=UPI001FEF58A0|nr:ras-related protein Rab-36 isoform X1 [Tachysurus fulvidraco]